MFEIEENGSTSTPTRCSRARRPAKMAMGLINWCREGWMGSCMDMCVCVCSTHVDNTQTRAQPKRHTTTHTFRLHPSPLSTQKHKQPPCQFIRTARSPGQRRGSGRPCCRPPAGWALLARGGGGGVGGGPNRGRAPIGPSPGLGPGFLYVFAVYVLGGINTSKDRKIGL